MGRLDLRVEQPFDGAVDPLLELFEVCAGVG
jgi:hypothetical protein